MSQVRSEIMDAQNAFQIQANLVSDILNTIQNLYRLANKREIAKIQDEFYRIYKTQDLEQLRRFQKQLDVIAEGYRAQSCWKCNFDYVVGIFWCMVALQIVWSYIWIIR